LIAVGFAPLENYASAPSYASTSSRNGEDEELRRMRQEAQENRDDTDLPTFLRRPVSIR
jgi:hypothetical protein